MDRERPILSSGLKRLIAGLSVLRSPEPEQLLSLMATAGVCAEELEPWADYGHSPSDSYGRQLVWHGGHVEVMVMTWLPGDFSAIHDHGLAQWGAVQCFGQAEHYSYRLRRLHLCDEQALPYGPGQVRAVSPALIHQMGNAGEQSFLSLHVYGCREPRTAVTASARVFDPDEGCIQFTSGGVFFALPESDIERRQYGLTADLAIRKRQGQLKAWRLRQMLALAA